jgi:hypothetical protein
LLERKPQIYCEVRKERREKERERESKGKRAKV